MNKKAGIIVGVIIAACIIITVVLMLIGIIPAPSFLKGSNDGNSLDTALKIINDHPTNVMILGDDIQFPDEFKYTKISKLDEDSLSKADAYQYYFLIINDLDNSVYLSDEEIDLIWDYIYNQHYSFIYLGEKYLSKWDNSQYIIDTEGSQCVAYQSEGGSVIRVTGLWGEEENEIYKEYQNLLGDMIIYQIEDCIRRNN